MYQENGAGAAIRELLQSRVARDVACPPRMQSGDDLNHGKEMAAGVPLHILMKTIARRGMIRILFIVLLYLSVPGAESATADETLLGPERPVRIATGIRQRPGAVAWAADGNTLAFVTDSLQLYDIPTQRLREIHLPSVSFISAGQQNMLYLLYGEGPDRRLASLEISSGEHKEILVSDHPDAVFALPDSRRLLLVYVRLRQKDIWAELSYMISVLDLKTSRTTLLYEEKKTISGRVRTADYQSAWLWPGLRPFDTEILALEYVKPPVVMPYLKIRLADYVTGKIREAGRIEHGAMSVPVSWSPDGSRFAYPDMKSRLGIHDLHASLRSNPSGTESIAGYYPSWNPKGSQIYFGGHIINSDGSGIKRIIDEGEESMGVWSPDGRRLAITDRNRLYFVQDFDAVLIPPDRIYDPAFLNKRMLLKELLVDKLITDQEYEERSNNLRKTVE